MFFGSTLHARVAAKSVHKIGLSHLAADIAASLLGHALRVLN